MITSQPDTITVQGQLYEYQVTATDADSGDVLTYSLLTAPAFLSIDAQTGLISGTPSNVDVGVHDVSVQVQDQAGATDRQDYRLHVENENDPPVVSDIPDQTVDEGQSFAQIPLDNYVSDPDNGDADMSWTYSGNTDLTVFIDANRVATITPPTADWNGSETITFTATDPGGLSDSDAATFTVSAVDDPPNFIQPLPVLTFNEDDSLFVADSYWYDFVEDADDPDSVLTFTALNNGEMVWERAEGSGRWFLSAADWFGSDTLSFTGSDGALSDTTQLIVHIQAVNDAPLIVNFPDSMSFKSGDTLHLFLTPFEQDVDTPNDRLSWKFSVSDSNMHVKYDSSERNLALTAVSLDNPCTLFAVLQDDSGATALDTAFVSVKQDTTAIKGADGRYAGAFHLYQNYPNPFNPTTTINYELRMMNYVEIIIYNVAGQKVATLVRQKQAAGKHSVIWNASALASGVYYYQLLTEQGLVQTKKLLLIK